MQRGRAKRCQVPIRTRRRQSDAKWRASVASCYETLKFIIPNGKALPKRKASKSLILQETEKHIGNLERAVSRLLNIEAQEQGQGVLWKRGDNWLPASVEDLQDDFAKQQRGIFQQSSQGRRCYNMLHDIQEEILGLTADSSSLAFLPLSPGGGGANTRDAATSCTSRRHRVSKARCRYETEKAGQRILAAYNTGDMITAVIPPPSTTITTTTGSTSTSTQLGDPHHHQQHQLQAVPTTPTVTNAPRGPEVSWSVCGPGGMVQVGGTSVRLQKLGNVFVQADQSPAAHTAQWWRRRAAEGNLSVSSRAGLSDRRVAEASTAFHGGGGGETPFHHHGGMSSFQRGTSFHGLSFDRHTSEETSYHSGTSFHGFPGSDRRAEATSFHGRAEGTSFHHGLDHGFDRHAAEGMSFPGSTRRAEVASFHGFDRAGMKQQRQQEGDQSQSMQEVPVVTTPHKVYGIARHDVMLHQESDVSGAEPRLPGVAVTKLTPRFSLRREDNGDRAVPCLSSVCKKLDFELPPQELMIDCDTAGSSPPLSLSLASVHTSHFNLKSTAHTLGLTPMKSETGSSAYGQGFTPMKTPTDSFMCDTALFSPNSAWALGSAMDARVPQAGLSDIEALTDMDDDHNLLCMESFDLDDMTDATNRDRTPLKQDSSPKAKHACRKRAGCKRKCPSGRKHGGGGDKPTPKCRKRLEGLYEKFAQGKADAKDAHLTADLLDNGKEWCDFEGYLLYYQQVSPGLKQQLGLTGEDADSLAAMVSGMWTRLPHEDRRTMVTLAALEKHDSNSSGSASLSQDLEDLNVLPIHTKEFM